MRARLVPIFIITRLSAAGCADFLDDGSGTTTGPMPVTDTEPARLAGITALHNAVRAAVPVPDLTWSGDLHAIAQAYAEKCVYQHSGRAGLGENLAGFTPVNRPVAAPMQVWSDEKTSYDYMTNSCAADRDCGHYTQIVWRATTSVGCGVAVCTTGSPLNVTPWELWVCNYAPPGNFIGQRPY